MSQLEYDHGSILVRMPVEKLSISLEQSVASAIREEAETSGVTISAWLSSAAEERLAINRGLAGVAEYEAEFGAFTEDEIAAADAELEALGIIGPRS
jgi:hypothetical protein